MTATARRTRTVERVPPLRIGQGASPGSSSGHRPDPELVLIEAALAHVIEVDRIEL
jgi:hypothetical protein